MADDPLRQIEHRLFQLETRSAVEDVHRSNVESRLSAIEDTLKWLVRLIIGALLLGAVAYALKGGFAIAGSFPAR
jgi:hypothetical protein